MPCRRQVTEELPAAKALFTKASDILGYDLLDRATNGPKDQLDSTVGLLLIWSTKYSVKPYLFSVHSL